MTDQLTALKELAEKVEAGDNFGIVPNSQKAFGYIESHAYSYELGEFYASAFSGSLDAAHALHKAVLGDRWQWAITLNGKVKLFNGHSMPRASSSLPARAWLLAVIRAKIQELEE